MESRHRHVSPASDACLLFYFVDYFNLELMNLILKALSFHLRQWQYLFLYVLTYKAIIQDFYFAGISFCSTPIMLINVGLIKR